MLLPRWARRLVLSHTCWQVKDKGAATNWAEGGSTEAVSGPAMSFLAEMFPDFRGWAISQDKQVQQRTWYSPSWNQTEQHCWGKWLSIRTARAALAHFGYTICSAWLAADTSSSIELHPDWPIILKLQKLDRNHMRRLENVHFVGARSCKRFSTFSEILFHSGHEEIAFGHPSDSENFGTFAAATSLSSLGFEEFQSFQLHP